MSGIPRTQCISHIASCTRNKTSRHLLGPVSRCVGCWRLIKPANFMNNVSIEWELIKGPWGLKITGQSAKNHPTMPRDHADDFIELIPWVYGPFPTYLTSPVWMLLISQVPYSLTIDSNLIRVFWGPTLCQMFPYVWSPYNSHCSPDRWGHLCSRP